MTIREEVIDALVKKATQLFGAGNYGPETRFVEDLQVKSVDMVKFAALLEDIYEVEVPFMEITQKQTFADAAAFIGQMFGE